jgi:aarF domain-containing kinase
LDFGAAREFDKPFIDTYIKIIHGASFKDRLKIIKYPYSPLFSPITPISPYSESKTLGFLTGEENLLMKEAHCDSVIAVGTPFQQHGEFDFGTQDMTEKVYKLMPVMLKNRLKPPPQEVYSLHRKLSGKFYLFYIGSFLLNMKIKAKFDSRKIFMDLYDDYKFT